MIEIFVVISKRLQEVVESTELVKLIRSN